MAFSVAEFLMHSLWTKERGVIRQGEAIIFVEVTKERAPDAAQRAALAA
jgi:hypothetical protein